MNNTDKFYSNVSQIALFVIFVFPTCFIAPYIPFWNKEYVPQTVLNAFHPTMMMFGFHALCCRLKNKLTVGIHIAFSLFSITALCIFAAEASIVKFGEVYKYSALASVSNSEATTIVTTTTATQGHIYLGSWLFLISWISILALMSVLHFAIGIMNIKDHANMKYAEDSFFKKNGSNPRIIVTFFAFISFVFCLGEVAISYFLLGNSVQLLNPIGTQNAVMCYISTACMLLPLPDRNKTKQNYKKHKKKTEEKHLTTEDEVIINGEHNNAHISTIIIVVAQIFNIIYTIIGLGTQSTWLNEHDITSACDLEKMQEVLQDETVFNFANFTNIQTLQFTDGSVSHTLPIENMKMFTCIEMGVSITYIIMTAIMAAGSITHVYFMIHGQEHEKYEEIPQSTDL